MLACAACLLVSVVAAANEIVSRVADGYAWAPHDILFGGAGIWLSLAPISPFPFYAARRWPIAAPRAWPRVALHVGLAFAFWAVASTLYEGVLAWLVNPHAAPAAAPTPAIL